MRWPQQNPGDPSTPRTGPSLHAPPLFSPTCPGSGFPAAASSAVVSEHPCVVLDEWWLARVEGQERKIAVAGFFQRNQTVLDFTAAPIAKCHSPYVLQTENGTVVLISHSLNIKRTLENGFTIEACEKFSLGFPQWWQNWNVLYPKMLSSQTGSQLSSSGTSKSHEDSSRFYMEMFQTGKCLDSLINNAFNKAKAFSSNGDAFPDSSHLPNGAPRFEEYGCDDDTPTIEKSAASNHDSNKVENMEIDLIRAIISKEGSHDGIDSNIASASMMECANDEGDVGIFNASRLNNGCQKTHAALLKRRGRLKKPQRVALSESVPGEGTATLAYSDVQSSEKGKKPVGTSRKQRSTFGKLQRATRSSNIISPIPYGNLSPLTCGWPKSFTMSTPESLKLKNTRSGRVVVPALVPGCQNIVYAPDGSISAIIGLNSPPPLKGSTSKNYARKKKRTN